MLLFSDRQTLRHQGNGNISLCFGLFLRFRTGTVLKLSFFWIFLQFLGGYLLANHGGTPGVGEIKVAADK